MSVSAYVSAASTSSSSASSVGVVLRHRRRGVDGVERVHVDLGFHREDRALRVADRARERTELVGHGVDDRDPELLEVHVARRHRGRVVEAAGRADVEAGHVAQLAGGGRVVHGGERDDLPPGRALGYPSAGAVSVHDRFLRSRAPTGCLADRGTTPAVGTVSIPEERAASGDALRHPHRRAGALPTPGGRGQLAGGPAAAIWRRARHPLPLSEPKTAGCRAPLCSSQVEPTEVLRKQVPAQV